MTINRQAFRWQRLCLVPREGDDMFVAFKVKPSWRPPVVHEHAGRRFIRTDKFTAGAGPCFPQTTDEVAIARLVIDPYPIYREEA